MNSFNLLDEEWIPIVCNDGMYRHQGILSVFQNAHLIREIASSNPMDRIAVLRFLLAVLYWCKGNPTVTDKQVNAFPDEWFTKLDDHRDCFNLLGEGKRFYQRRGTRRPRPTTDLIHELPTANNPWHFNHLTDGNDGLCVRCCALALLRLPLFTTLGGAGGKVTNYLYPGINGTPPIYKLLKGKTLYETLMENWLTTELETGLPIWDSDTDTSIASSPSLLAGLTHLPRQIWLAGLEKGICALCGTNEGRIRFCNIESPGKNENENWIDPHALFRFDKDELKPTRSIDPTKSKFVMNTQWLSIYASLLTLNPIPSNNVTYMLVAFTTDKADKIDITESILSTRIPSERLDSVQNILGTWRKSVRLPLRVETKERPVSSTFRPHVEHLVSQHASILLQGDDDGWNKAVGKWEVPLKVMARSLAPDYSAVNLLRRQQIERAIPEWKEPAPEGEKPKKARKRK